MLPEEELGGGCLDGDLCDPISCLVENGGCAVFYQGGDDDAGENHNNGWKLIETNYKAVLLL